LQSIVSRCTGSSRLGHPSLPGQSTASNASFLKSFCACRRSSSQYAICNLWERLSPKVGEFNSAMIPNLTEAVRHGDFRYRRGVGHDQSRTGQANFAADGRAI
jgi:hypothetical protein